MTRFQLIRFPVSQSGSWWMQTSDDSDSIAYDYQWAQATPDGSVISFGPQNLVARLETENLGAWTDGPPGNDVALRVYGSYIGSRQHNLTILADGSVLVTGGNTDGTRYYSADGGAQLPELWGPSTGQFSLLNPMQGDRQHHPSALLLQDGRELSGAGGICGDCYAAGCEERNAEIFTPSYLYAGDASLAARPALSSVPEAADYGETVQVSTNLGARITWAHLIKLDSIAHSENQDQRLVPLSFTQSGTAITFPVPSKNYTANLIDTASISEIPSTKRR